WRGALFRPPRLGGRRYLCAVRATDAGGRHHQPTAARRRHGVRALARPAFDRAAAEGRSTATTGALEIDVQYGPVVIKAEHLVRDEGLASIGQPWFHTAPPPRNC